MLFLSSQSHFSNRRRDKCLLLLLNFLLSISSYQCFSAPTTNNKANLWNSYILVNSQDTILARCDELQPEDDRPDEDELEMLFPTVRRHFTFGSDKDVMIRETSFGCSKMGHQVWPSAIALSLYMISCTDELSIEDQSVMELGAGCGLPSVVCRDVLQAKAVLATDFWIQSVDDFEKDRLIPDNWHRTNLDFNVAKPLSATIRHVDWHDPQTVEQALESSKPKLVVGSDLVYYSMDVNPLWNTIELCLDRTIGGADQVILILPIKDTRESLPEFKALLESKSSEDFYHVDMDELSMHRGEANDTVDHFLKISISIKT
jgi:predicted nicotinamide N-methyase